MDNQLKGEFILNSGETPIVTSDAPGTALPNTPLKKLAHFYNSYCSNPSGITFAEQEENEDIILLLRRHFVTNLPWIVTAIFLLLLPVIFPFVINSFPFPLPSSHTLLLFLAFYYVAIFGFVILNFTLWYFQAGLVTNVRLVDVDLSGVLYRQISETKLQKIEDVTYTQIGFILSLFNYGTVLVQTAGAEENIEYDRVPRPSKVAEIIGDLSQGA